MTPWIPALLLVVGAHEALLSPSDLCNGLALNDVARAAGIDFVHDRGASDRKHLPETMGSGLAWLDFDGDGWLDLYVVQSGPFPPGGSERAANRLYRNRGDGSFEDITETAGVGDRGYGQGTVAGDVNGDGHPDLYVCNYGPDTLYLNQGDGRFEDTTRRAGLGLDGWSSSAALADADGDGDLDLYVTRYLEYDPKDEIFCGDVARGRRDYCHPHLFRGATDRFYRNRGDGTFEDATAQAGLAGADGKGLGVIFVDLDDGGLPDIYVANDTTINFLFRNRGDGSFEDISLVSGAGMNRDGQAEAGMGLAVGDVDGDGDPDLAVANFDTETNTLYRNIGNLLFEDISAPSGFGLPSFNLLGFGIAMVDFDLDGDLDAYIANGHILEEPGRQGVTYPQRDLLLLGERNARFQRAHCGSALERVAVGRGVAHADYDNDGDVDLAVQNSGGPLQLIANDGTKARWLGVRLRGQPPNTEAIGARVTLRSAHSRQPRWVTGGTSYQSSSDRRVLFGLPEDDPPESLEVVWPSGRITDLPYSDAMRGRYVDISEPDERSKP